MRVFPIHRERAANFDLAAFWFESEDETRTYAPGFGASMESRETERLRELVIRQAGLPSLRWRHRATGTRSNVAVALLFCRLLGNL